MAADQDLLARHAPLLRYDPQDVYRAIAAEAAVSNPGNVLVDGDGEVIARSQPDDDGPPADPLDLALLADHGGRDDVAGERLAFAPAVAAAARRMQAAGGPLAGRIHGRARPARDGGTWLQYWFFYYYNPKNLGGLGKHEGDWEMIQVHLGPDGRPDRVTYAQHDFGDRRDWDEIESVEGHPVVYVGQLSHASYFDRGSFPYAVIKRFLPLGIDHALGGTTPGGRDGPEEIPRVDPLDEDGWALWPGRWGSGERTITLIAPQGDGPPSPGNQGDKWGDPDAFDASQAHAGALIRRAVSAVMHFAGRLTYPETVTVDSARLDGDRVEVTFTPRSKLLRRTKYVVLTINEAGDGQLVLAGRTIRRPASPATVSFRIRRRGEGPLRVWASAFNGPRQRSDPTSLDVAS